MGLGTRWVSQGLATAGQYTGKNALREYRDMTGDTDATFVPLYGTGHWSIPAIATDVMAYSSEQFKSVSRLTIASLEDLGYSVNYGAADPFIPPVTSAIFGNV